jgi:hypothetical protein
MERGGERQQEHTPGQVDPKWRGSLSCNTAKRDKKTPIRENPCKVLSEKWAKYSPMILRTFLILLRAKLSVKPSRYDEATAPPIWIIATLET